MLWNHALISSIFVESWFLNDLNNELSLSWKLFKINPDKQQNDGDCAISGTPIRPSGLPILTLQLNMLQ